MSDGDGVSMCREAVVVVVVLELDREWFLEFCDFAPIDLRVWLVIAQCSCYVWVTATAIAADNGNFVCE